jgi:trimeric autotransporter adhesin
VSRVAGDQGRVRRVQARLDHRVRSVSPTSVVVGSSATTLTVNGTGFTSTSLAEVGGAPEPTTFVSSTELTAVVPASQLQSGATLDVVVTNGAASSSPASASLVVNNPAPAISQVSPSGVLLGAGSTSVAITGTGFVPSTTVQVNGSTRTTAYSSATQINAQLTATDLAAAGTLSITATNPAPGRRNVFAGCFHDKQPGSRSNFAEPE